MPGHLLAGGHYDWCLRMVLFKCIALGEQMCRRKFMVYACMRLDVVQVLYAKKHFFSVPRIPEERVQKKCMPKYV